MWLKLWFNFHEEAYESVSVLYREPMWLKPIASRSRRIMATVSVLYREPMWLKLVVPVQQS